MNKYHNIFSLYKSKNFIKKINSNPSDFNLLNYKNLKSHYPKYNIYNCPTRIDVKKKSQKLTVILDLDDTLITVYDNNIYIRPHVLKLLTFLHISNIETILWSAGKHDHVEYALSIIDPSNKFFDYIICHGNSWIENGIIKKDLTKIPRPITYLLQIDNDPNVLVLPNSAIVIPNYIYNYKNDKVLLNLIPIIYQLNKDLLYNKIISVDKWLQIFFICYNIYRFKLCQDSFYYLLQ